MSINPLGAPINYTATMPDLSQAFQGFGEALQGVQQRHQADALRQQYAADLQSTLANPTQQAWGALIAKYPQQREAFAKSAELYGKDKVQNEFWQGMEVSNALENGNPDVAKAKLTELVAARKNSGQPAGIYEQVLSALDNGNIQGAQGATNMALSMLDPDAFQKALKNKVEAGTTEAQIAAAKSKAEKEGYEAKQTPQRLALEAAKTMGEIRNIDSQIGERAARLNLDRDKLQSDVEMKLYEFGQKNAQLDTDGRKLVNDSVVAAVAAGQTAGLMDDLATRLEQAGGGYGGLSRASEWFKEATGNQNYMSELRKEYVRLKNNQAIKSLPPGPATDKDIDMAMRGFPSDTADASTIASFLRGMSKMNNLTAATENAKAEWVNSVGSLGRATRDVVVDGVKVPAGMSFVDFTKNYVANKAKQSATETQQQALPQRSYMRWAKPQGTPQAGQLGSGTYGQ